MQPEELTVGPEAAGERLDVFLAGVAGSRAAAQKLIDAGRVTVDGVPQPKRHPLTAGARVVVAAPAQATAAPALPSADYAVAYRDEDVLVIDKPAGVVVHPGSGRAEGTLVQALAGLVAGGDDPLRPGIVHRLDRDTSGAIVVAKTARAHENLSDQFRARTVFKSYVALVHGVTREEKGKVEEPLSRDPRNRTRMAVSRGGRAAVSLWRVRRRFERMTLLDVEIKTGRTHQIRVHLAWMNHPVVGDETYGGGRDKNLHDPRLRAAVASLGRQFLHAARLGFHHPTTGQWLGFDAPLPADLAGLLEQLK